MPVLGHNRRRMFSAYFCTDIGVVLSYAADDRSNHKMPPASKLHEVQRR
jgi:hypothetical protein